MYIVFYPIQFYKQHIDLKCISLNSVTIGKYYLNVNLCMHTAYRASVTANYISGNEKEKERKRKKERDRRNMKK